MTDHDEPEADELDEFSKRRVDRNLGDLREFFEAATLAAMFGYAAAHVGTLAENDL